MHDQRIAAGGDDRARKVVERDLRILVVDADAALHGDWHGSRTLHRLDAPRHEIRLRHEASAETAVLHAVGGAADVEVDLVLTELLADPRRQRQLARSRP